MVSGRILQAKSSSMNLACKLIGSFGTCRTPAHHVCDGLFSRQAYVVLISIAIFSTQKTNIKEKCHHMLLLKLSKKFQSLDYERL